MNLTPHPLVSIVTPVYNEEEHLAECIESVLAQRYQHWEYTIVNNCSTDRSLEIARHYAARDHRIRVHDNERFLPMLANHNIAVRQISPGSKYCKVVLGDDSIFPGCLEHMVALAEAQPSIGMVSAYEQFGEQVRLTGLPADTTLVQGREACRQFLMGTLVLFGSQTSVLYRADLVRRRNPFYVETDQYADFEACFALLQTADLGFVHQVLTFSRPRPQSIGAIAADIGAHFRSILGLLFTYGRDCLTSDEFSACQDRFLSQYYQFLGRRLLVEYDHGFWPYHRHAFAALGLDFSRVRLAQAALRDLGRSLLAPQDAMERIKRLVKLKALRTREMRRVVLDAPAQRKPAEGIEPGNQREKTVPGLAPRHV